MTPDLQVRQRRLCRTCGEDITEHARYTRWTQCGYCYWKERLERQSPLNELLARRGDLKKRIAELETRSGQLAPELKNLERRLLIARPFWKKLLGITPQDSRLDELRRSVQDSHSELWKLRDERRQLESSIQDARHVRKRYDSASQRRVAAQKRKAKANKRKEEVASDSIERSYLPDFDRGLFRIRNKDYKRGNALDNHLRNGISDTVISAFGGCCLRCGGTYNLTLDHFAIPKNEGGNFVLQLQDSDSIKLNIAVLCRSCNAAKGERSFERFFTEEEVAKALDYQRTLLKWILDDQATMKTIRKWYRK